MITANGPVTIGTDMSGNLASTPIRLDQHYGFTIQLAWTGTPVGNFTLEASNDNGSIEPNNTIDNVTHWTTIANSSSAAGGAASNLMYNVNLAFYRWVRVVYTATSGSGTLTNARFEIKGV